MAEFAVGDSVQIKGVIGGGQTGTIVKIGRPVYLLFYKTYFVQLDGPWFGKTMLKVGKMNLRKLTATNGMERSCPLCAETIKAAAVKCRFCGADLWTVDSDNQSS